MQGPVPWRGRGHYGPLRRASPDKNERTLSSTPAVSGRDSGMGGSSPSAKSSWQATHTARVQSLGITGLNPLWQTPPEQVLCTSGSVCAHWAGVP